MKLAIKRILATIFILGVCLSITSCTSNQEEGKVTKNDKKIIVGMRLVYNFSRQR